MTILQRLSDTFWWLVTPTKTPATKPAPATIKAAKTAPAKSTQHPERSILQRPVNTDLSMSPSERVGNWRFGGSRSVARKRKQPLTPPSTSRRSKKPRVDSVMSYGYDADEDEDDLDMDVDDTASLLSSIQVTAKRGDIRAAPPDGSEGDLDGDDSESGIADNDPMDDDDSEGETADDDLTNTDDSQDEITDVDMMDIDEEEATYHPIEYDDEGGSLSDRVRSADEGDNEEERLRDSTVALSPTSYSNASPYRRKIAPLPAESVYLSHGVSTKELRSAGWDDGHIALVQKLARRGFEPLLPNCCQRAMAFLPDQLFSEDSDAFLGSVRALSNSAERALNEILDLGGRIRGQIRYGGKPEEQVRKRLAMYEKFTMNDANLDKRTRIPIVKVMCMPVDTPAATVQQVAQRKMARLARKYATAFTARESIEREGTLISQRFTQQLTYPTPTLYGIIASHALVALVAYRPADAVPDIKTVAMFDFNDKNHDVWNALAMAIVFCHARGVMLKIAEDTGLGVKPINWRELESDPDA